jgi:hypothetical protein
MQPLIWPLCLAVLLLGSAVALDPRVYNTDGNLVMNVGSGKTVSSR